MSRSGQDETVTVFLGNLSRDATKEEVEKAFGYYGKLKSVWLSRSPSGFGFIEFEDHQDAVDAVKGLDGEKLCGTRVRVEFSRGRARSSRESGRSSRRRSSSRSPRSRKPFSPHDICYECGGSNVCLDRGHYAYDCEIRLRRQRRLRSDSRSRSRTPKKSSKKSRSSPSRHRRSRSHSDKKKRSPTRSSSSSSSSSDSSSRSRTKSPPKSGASR